MGKENKITISDFLNCQMCIIEMLSSIEKNNVQELEYVYSKIFPYGKTKISDLFYLDSFQHRIGKHVRIFFSLPDYFR
ncbi:hypothetical protein EQ871_12020 [Enterococcus casseliflavus]|jgi:hypothetical protein|uniref:hypothetical protein n=1 Tax=Enterococcus casseliflavus TaxID=37734 RepID=UPI000FFBE4F0|nr:hypothetical protein [Enterococcus casseliflavus]RXA62617.1 hypothetical protein EQ871_12020 [Enterococcus casseliflavus]